MSNVVRWNCPHCGKADRYDGEFSVGFGFTKFYHYHNERTNEVERTEHTLECKDCQKRYIVRLDTRVVAVVAPVGEFIEQGVAA